MEVGKCLIRKGNQVTVITEKFDNNLKNEEIIEGIKIVRFSYNKIKYFGLISIWLWLFKHRHMIKKADVVHCQDVFIWYLPFRFIYPKKKIFTTIHGFEWDDPLFKISLYQKRLAIKLSTRSIGVGKFLEKYLHVHFDLVTYGAANNMAQKETKKANSIVYVGRLEENTGVLKFLSWLKSNPSYKVTFCGNGKERNNCEKYGTVYGFTDPMPFYKPAKYCVPGGYLAALEALNAGCELKLFWNNKVKENYWKMSPFIKKDATAWAKKQTWEKLTDEYLNLYNSI